LGQGNRRGHENEVAPTCTLSRKSYPISYPFYWGTQRGGKRKMAFRRKPGSWTSPLRGKAVGSARFFFWRQKKKGALERKGQRKRKGTSRSSASPAMDSQKLYGGDKRGEGRQYHVTGNPYLYELYQNVGRKKGKATKEGKKGNKREATN